MEDLQKIWPHRWITPKAKSFNSEIHGLGVIAIKPISKGEPIVVYGGIIVPKSEIKEYRKIMGHAGIQVDDDFFIVPTSRNELNKTGIINHSCEPNIGFESTIKLIAIKDINAGDEIVLDYAFCETFIDDFECNCGSSNCRKIITGNDWKNKDVQEKYKEFFSPYLCSKISL